MKIQKLDKYMRLKDASLKDLEWISPKDFPFCVSGLAWFKKERIYRRLPVKPEYPVRKAVDSLAACTSGGQLKFQSDTGKLAIYVELHDTADMNHMTATGQCGFDCYIGNPGKQLYFSTIQYKNEKISYEYMLFDLPKNEMRNITLNFPLYQGVKEIYLGFEKEAGFLRPVPYADQTKIIVYGTSITQGGCATRPGMSFTNILSRRLNYEFINLGFSGNGRGEPELAKIISEIENPGLFVLDYEGNSGFKQLKKTLPDFIRILRAKHKFTPIVVLSQISLAREKFNIDLKNARQERKEFQYKTVKYFQKKGDKNIYFFDGSVMLGRNFEECSVDGIHPTDLGFLRMADSISPFLKKIISKR
jgi:lysophospholipase L1-like esterase